MSFQNFTEEQIESLLNLGDDQSSGPKVKKAQFTRFTPPKVEETRENINFLNDVELEFKVELGTASISLREVLNLHEEQVLPLNRIAGDTVDVKINNVWLAHGEVLVLNEVLGIRISSFSRDEEIWSRGAK
ncbi:MAG: FliM/FliN family flagellar motor switch protein [Syntrophomonadaceae bacterium]|nr:FliM/FliN family flagellar motor switch protein [Syntrophomonadaceae bacterium]